ncbi:MAG: RNB domain-containing ribonuclease [Verrucomicrobiota bacterium]|nr:RNB domain-containing ribonuclease [Verrucomicrobiota bacterium]
MKKNEARELILDLFRQACDRAYSAGEIAAAFSLRGKPKKKLTGWLKRLCVEGLLAQTMQRYHRPLPAARRHATDAGARNSGRIAGQRAHAHRRPAVRRELPAECVGTLQHEGAALFVTPADRALNARIRVADARGAGIGDRVIVRLREDATARHIPAADRAGAPSSMQGDIVEALGPAGALSTETLAAIRHYGLAETFSDEVIAESEQALELVHVPGPRMDARDKLIVTIDPERARDFDDALSLDTDSSGNRVLGVHIADVGHYVRAGSALDGEARRRGNSVYLPDRVLPMLPTSLSNGVCSLRPGEDRLALSVFLAFDPNGRVVRREFAKTIIRNRVRLTYEQAFHMLGKRRPAGGASEVPPPPRPRAFEDDSSLETPARALLLQLSALAQQLRRRRFERGALDLDAPDMEIILDSKQTVSGLRLIENDLSHQLIEECMVAANEAVALELVNRGVTIIARLHEPPSEEKMADLTFALGRLGFSPGDITQPRVLARFLQAIGGHPLANYARTLALRSMKRALYSARASGHFGLAKRYYSHFTSPIRRYPDLILHRQLAASLPAGATTPTHLGAGMRLLEKEELIRVAFACSESERTAEEAERFVVDNMKFRYLAARIRAPEAETYDAVVVRIMRIGVFVEAPALQTQGLIPAAAFSAIGKRPRVDRNRRRVFLAPFAPAGRAHHGPKGAYFTREREICGLGDRVLEPGSPIRVTVSRVNLQKMQIDFAPAAKTAAGDCPSTSKGWRTRILPS